MKTKRFQPTTNELTNQEMVKSLGRNPVFLALVPVGVKEIGCGGGQWGRRLAMREGPVETRGSHWTAGLLVIEPGPPLMPHDLGKRNNMDSSSPLRSFQAYFSLSLTTNEFDEKKAPQGTP